MKQSQHYIGYMDILGYKDFFEHHEDETESFLNTIEGAFEETVAEIEKNGKNEADSKDEFKPIIRVFSDNILIAIKCRRTTTDNYMPYLNLIKLMSNIQLRFITKYELVLRGAVTKGLFYSNKRLVFGKALVLAHEMERKAVFPRIIVERSDIEEIIDFVNLNTDNEQQGLRQVISVLLSTSLAKDGDDYYFINYLPTLFFDMNHLYHINIQTFFTLSYTGQTQNILNFRDGAIKPIDQKEPFTEHRKMLLRKIAVFGNYDDLAMNTICMEKDIELRKSVLLKYLWALDYHNKACELAGLNECRIEYFMRTDTQTHQPIIEVIEKELDDTIKETSEG